LWLVAVAVAAPIQTVVAVAVQVGLEPELRLQLPPELLTP
jgi:hypothetical protein